jgi:hypothetical protein
MFSFTASLKRRAAIALLLATTSGAGIFIACSRSNNAGTNPNPMLGERQAMRQSDLEVNPPQLAAGEAAALRITVRDASGSPTLRLPLAHGKALHAIIVSADLDYFAHVHPSPEESAFVIRHTFEEGGEYLLILDYQTPSGEPALDRHSLSVRGPRRAHSPLAESPRRQKAGELELTLRNDSQLRAGVPTTLHFDVTHAETQLPVNDLERYLGASAHFIALSADGGDFVHVHPLENADRPAHLAAHAAFPRPGFYKLWAQVQHRGAVLTLPFVLRVGEEEAQAKPALGPESAHSHHQHHH